MIVSDIALSGWFIGSMCLTRSLRLRHRAHSQLTPSPIGLTGAITLIIRIFYLYKLMDFIN